MDDDEVCECCGRYVGDLEEDEDGIFLCPYCREELDDEQDS